ncbi:NADP oxidoreductase [Bacteroidia bacterium]|nr:NADP oxidoreductase [Bacteroidia bacterium]
MADLRKMKEEVQNQLSLRENADNAEKLVQIKVAMATCGIASGAKQTMDFLIADLDKRNIPAVVTQTGCMGYCYAEPTIEVKKPGKNPVIFGNVDPKQAEKIIDDYIVNDKLVDGIIPVNYKTIDEK